MKYLRSLGLIGLLACQSNLFGGDFVSTTVTFQQGVDGYSGTNERRIGRLEGEEGTDPYDTTATSFFLDGGPAASDRKDHLIRFDDAIGGLGIPTGAVILSAELTVTTTSSSVSANSQSNGAFNVYSLASPFDGSTLFNDYVANDAGIDGGTLGILGSFDGMTTADSVVSARVDRAVQAWVNGSTNFGIGIRSDRSGDGWSIHTSQSADPATRPQLSVTYTTSPYVELQSQAPTLDSFPNGVSGPSVGTIVDGSTGSEFFIDGDNGNDSFDQPYLVRFDNTNLSTYVDIALAELVLVTGFASGAADSPGPFTVHQMLVDWDAATSYADLDSDGNTLLSDASELLAAGMIGPAAATLTGINDTEVIHADITSIVENWRNGDANYGLYIGAGTSNGWQIFASGAADPSYRPELRIVGVTVPEPGSLAIVATLIASSVWFVRRR